MKKLISMVIVVVMCLAVSSISIAADETQPKKVIGKAGANIFIYRVPQAGFILAEDFQVTVLSETDIPVKIAENAPPLMLKAYIFSAAYDRPILKGRDKNYTFEEYSKVIPKIFHHQFLILESQTEVIE